MAEAKQDRRDRGRGGGPPEFPELLQRAEALVPVLRERAGKAEELRRLPDETIEDLHRSGLFRILQPRRVGGSELPFRSIVELVAVIGRGCGSTAWVLANLAAHQIIQRLFAGDFLPSQPFPVGGQIKLLRHIDHIVRLGIQ